MSCYGGQLQAWDSLAWPCCGSSSLALLFQAPHSKNHDARVQGLESATWEEAIKATADALGKVKGNEISFIAGKLADAESLMALKVS